jgi:flagellar biosynthetic protein FliQ
MSTDALYEALKLCLAEAIIVSAPFVAVSLLVGILVSLLQTVTSVQEASLTFVPKMLAAAACLWLLGPWLLHKLGTMVALFLERAGRLGT